MRPLCEICAALTSVLLLACASEPTPTNTAATTEPPPAAATGSPVEPISSRQGSPAPAAANRPPSGEGQELLAPGARFQLPADWQRETPSQTMRLAQARIPGSGGDAQLTVFFFGPGGGGGVEDNLARWAGQIEANSPAERGQIESSPYKSHWISVEGTLKPSTMGTGPTTPQPGSGLLGAVVEGSGGPWFFKATGPAATLQEQREAFFAMLRSVEQP